MVDKSNFFYASDLAQLYNISKQTLIFYDKKDIFKPDYVDTNGYRMYSLKQFFILGIILDLKNIGLPLNEIGSFLQHRTPNDTLTMLKSQLTKLHKQISLAEKYVQLIENKIKTIQNYTEHTLNEVTLSYKEKEYFLVSKDIALQISQKDRFLIATKFLNSAVDNDGVKQYDVSGFIFNNNIIEQSPKSYKVFCKTNIDNYNYIKPHNLYMQIYVKTNFYNAINLAKPMLLNFSKALNLNLDSIIYITTLKNYWASDSHDSFISKIEIPVLPSN